MLRRGKCLILKLRPPRKSIPTETRRLIQKRWRYSQKCVLQSCARNHKKKINKKTFNMIFHPNAGGPCFVDCYKVLHVGWQPRRNHAYQISRRSRRGLRSYGGQKSGFSYSFLNGSYNSATHYRAKLWLGISPMSTKYLNTVTKGNSNWYLNCLRKVLGIPSDRAQYLWWIYLSQCSTVVRNTVVRAVQKWIGKPRFCTPVAP